MNRHVIDHRRADSAARFVRFVGIERKARVPKDSPSERLRRAPRQVNDRTRMQRFLRILRSAG